MAENQEYLLLSGIAAIDNRWRCNHPEVMQYEVLQVFLTQPLLAKRVISLPVAVCNRQVLGDLSL